MSPEDWKTTESLFESAAALPKAERTAFLDANDGGNEEVRRQVEKLLDGDENAEDFIEASVWTSNSIFKLAEEDAMDDDPAVAPFDKYIGGRIGQYTVIKALGRGGMGNIYLAERSDGEFEQKVAIKLIKLGMDSDFVIQRFRHERQIVASLDHPYIGRLLDGGTTSDNEPYFVMEYITGRTLYDHCDGARMNISDRLKLFRKICEAVEYAHCRSIIHRDIKPANIIVNHAGEPKLVDFGIAKILDPDLLHVSSSPTASMLRMMTPEYASPEQMYGGDISPRTDIYSLGVLLFELVTGHRPYYFDPRSMKDAAVAICEHPPAVASKAVGSPRLLLRRYNGNIGEVFTSRGTSRRELIDILSGDLENIIAAALIKEPADRYASAEEFSDEIDKFLRGLPIDAGRQGRFLSAGGPATLFKPMPLAVLPFSMLDTGRGDGGEDQYLCIGMADALISRLSRSSNFSVRPTNSVLRYHGTEVDPVKVGDELHVDHLLTGNIKRTDERTRVTVQLLDLKTNSAVWAASVDEDGSDLLSVEDSLAGKVVDALIPHLSGHDREELAKRGTNVPKAFEHYLRGRYYFNNFTEDGLARAFVSFHNAVAADPNYAAAYSGIADYYTWLGIIGVLPPQECFQPAIAAASKAVDLDPQLSDPHASLGFSLHAGNFDWSGAEQNLRHAIELNSSNATAFAWLAIVLITQGRFDEGIAAARRAVELDPVTPFKHHNVAWNLYFARRFDEAADHYENVVRMFPEYSFGHYGLSKVYRRLGQNDRALKEAMLVVQTAGDSNFAKFCLAETLAANGRIAEAAGVLQSLIELGKTRYISPYHQSLVHCCMAENQTSPERTASIEKAFACLNEAFEIKDAWLNWMGVEPTFDILRADRRFGEILEKAGYDTFGYNYKAASAEAEKLTTKENVFERTTLIDDSSSTQGTIYRTFAQRYAIPAALFAIAVITLAFFYFEGYFSFGKQPQTVASLTSTGAKRVVILPFTGADPNAATMGSGVADALSQKLGSIKALEIVSANSGRTMASETDAKLREVLKANYALRGSITLGERSATVDANFVDLISGTTLWSGSFDAPDGDLFKLQSVLAAKIWTSLGIEPLPLERQMVERVYTENAEAYQLYLIGRFQLTNRSSADIRKAIVSFSESIKLDPMFAPAYVGLADAYSLLNLYSVEPPPDAYKLAGEYASKALAIDPDLAEAHASLGYVKFYYERDREAAELEFRRAIQLNPSYAQAHHWFALALAGMGDPLKALEEIRIAQWLDPSSLAIKAAAGMVLFFNGKYTEALNECDAALAVDQNFIPAIKVKRWIYSAQNDRSAAKATFAKEIAYSGGEADNPGWQIVQAQVEEPSYLPKLKQAALSGEIQERPFAYAFETALAFAALGDSDNAFKFLEAAERSRSHGFNFAAVDPRLEEMRKDPRVRRLLAKLNPRK